MESPDQETKAERREQKKAKRRFRLHGSSLRAIYRNIILKRLTKRKDK